MSTLVDVNPWRFLNELLDVDSRAFKSMRARAAGHFPPVNVFLDEDAAIVDLELPGRTGKDVSLTLEPQAITVADKPAVVKDAAGHEVEVRPAWSRRLELPFRVDPEKANAKFTNGILRVELPKVVEETVRHIEIAD
ncbi:MAG TPA: hypothetical protein DDY72_00305 [Verrucomicrobia bacterium]|nr:hypothetical protein [Verrucomicrobiota bacterium]